MVPHPTAGLLRPVSLVGWTVVVAATIGTVAATRAAGPLRVHPDNPRYLTDDTGRPILLAGCHTWPNLVDMGPSDPPPTFDFEAYLDWLDHYGHNLTRGWTWEPTRWHTSQMKNPAWRNGDHAISPQPWRRTGPGLAADGKPRFDLEQLEPEYLRRLEARVDLAGRRGIYMSVMLFEGYGVQFQKEAWANHPFNPANNVNGIDGDRDGDGKGIEMHQLGQPQVTRLQEAYVRRVVESLNRFDNLLYEVGNETHPSSTDFQYHMIRFVKEVEVGLPKQHPVGMTYQNKRGKNETLFAGPADWGSPNAAGGSRDDPPDMGGRKVVISDTDHLWGIGGDVIWVWKTVTAGNNLLFMDTYDGRVLGTRRDEEFDPVRRTLGVAASLGRELDLTTCLPDRKAASTGHCLARRGHAYLAFAPHGGSFELDLTDTGGRFVATWIDPMSGERTATSGVAGGTRRSFSPPAAGPALLLLTRSDS